MRLIVQNNFCYLNEFKNQEVEILFAPIYKSQVQKQFFIKRFHEIQKHFPKITWCESLELESSDRVLSWNAYYEKEAFGDNIYPKQNRLFDHLDFDVPDSFTGFRKNAEKYLPNYFDNASTPIDSELKADLDYYFEKKLPLTYFDTRNGLVGRDFSTKFSAHLSCGSLDVKFLYNKVKDFEKENTANKSTYWIIFELLWREFFYWHYQKYPRQYFSELGLRSKECDFSDFKRYEISELKEISQIDFFHAALNELEATGFLSNRVRQIFASIWINDLELNWRSGADLFETYLIDYDVYSNYGNWMYLAGIGVDPRGKRYFNLEKQLKNYDPEGMYLKRWL